MLELIALFWLLASGFCLHFCTLQAIKNWLLAPFLHTASDQKLELGKACE